VNFANTSVNADSVVWDFAGLGSATGDSVSFQFPQTDSFEVCLIAYGACGIDTICQMVWAENISVVEFEIQSRLSVYPNPNSGRFVVDYQMESAGDIRIDIVDLSGKLIMRDDVRGVQGMFQKQYDFGHIANGSYMIRLHSPDGIVTRRVVVTK
jgi:hypothetical protein